MKTQSICFSSISKERSLRQDFDFHQYSNKYAEDYYRFVDLFEIISSEKINIDNLYHQFYYCEIGNVEKTGDVFPVTLDFSERNLLEENYYKKIEKGDIISVDKDDILLAKVRPNLKKYVRITDDLKDTFFTSAFIRIKSKHIPEVMYYCFRNLFYTDLMAVSRQGKGYPTLNENDLLTLRFSKKIVDKLISAKENITPKIADIENSILCKKLLQKETSCIIDSVFEKEFDFDYSTFEKVKQIKIFSCNQSNFSNNLDLRFSSKFHREAGNFVMSQLTSVTDKKIKHFLSEPIVLGASISPDDYVEDGECYYISMATIKGWSFDSESARTVSKAYSDAKSEKTVRKNDIILARSGEGTIGKVALIDNVDVQGVFADFTMRIRLKNYNSEFAYYYFRTSYFQYLIEIWKKGLGNNTNIFPIVIQEFPLIDISFEEQQRIVDEIHAEIAKQDAIKAEIADLRAKIDKIIEDTIRDDM